MFNLPTAQVALGFENLVFPELLLVLSQIYALLGYIVFFLLFYFWDIFKQCVQQKTTILFYDIDIN